MPQQVLFFDRSCNYTPGQDAVYRIEIDTFNKAYFFYQPVSSEAFYHEYLTHTDNNNFLIKYLSILLRSLTDVHY